MKIELTSEQVAHVVAGVEAEDVLVTAYDGRGFADLGDGLSGYKPIDEQKFLWKTRGTPADLLAFENMPDEFLLLLDDDYTDEQKMMVHNTIGANYHLQRRGGRAGHYIRLSDIEGGGYDDDVKCPTYQLMSGEKLVAKFIKDIPWKLRSVYATAVAELAGPKHGPGDDVPGFPSGSGKDD